MGGCCAKTQSAKQEFSPIEFSTNESPKKDNANVSAMKIQRNFRKLVEKRKLLQSIDNHKLLIDNAIERMKDQNKNVIVNTVENTLDKLKNLIYIPFNENL